MCMCGMWNVCVLGSERLKDTKSHGKVLQEAGFINKSIYVLGKVIAGAFVIRVATTAVCISFPGW